MLLCAVRLGLGSEKRRDWLLWLIDSIRRSFIHSAMMIHSFAWLIGVLVVFCSGSEQFKQGMLIFCTHDWLGCYSRSIRLKISKKKMNEFSKTSQSFLPKRQAGRLNQPIPTFWYVVVHNSTYGIRRYNRSRALNQYSTGTAWHVHITVISEQTSTVQYSSPPYLFISLIFYLLPSTYLRETLQTRRSNRF